MHTYPTASGRVTSRAMAAKAITVSLALATTLASQAQDRPIGGDRFAPGTAVAAIVKVPTPWYAPRFFVVRKMRETIPQYQSLPGLAFKAFSFAQADGAFGGIYLWKDLASARAWFSPAWFERVRRERGAAGEVRFFEVLAAIDTVAGGTPANEDSPSISTLWVSDAVAPAARAEASDSLQAGMDADRRVPGLLRRYYLLTPQGQRAQISIWRDRDSAQQAMARQPDSKTPGGAGQNAIEWFDTPILLPSAQAANQLHLSGL